MRKCKYCGSTNNVKYDTCNACYIEALKLALRDLEISAEELDMLGEYEELELTEYSIEKVEEALVSCGYLGG